MTTTTPIVQDLAFMQHIMASGPGIVAIVRESDLKIVFVNDLFEHEMGHTNEEVCNGNIYFSDFMDVYQQDRLKYHMQSVKNIYTRSTAYTIYKLNGKKRGLLSYYLFLGPISDPEGKHDNLFKILIQPDLSKWNLPFTSFETRELFLEHFQSEDFGTFEWLIGIDQSFWSIGVYRIYEIDPSIGTVSRSFAASFIHPDDMEWIGAKMADVLAGNGELNAEFRIITANRKIKIVHSLGRLIKNDAGDPIKFIGSLRDVTKQRNIEDELKSKVDMLYNSNKELEEFAYVASHDMQEPLRKITTFSSRLSDKYRDVLTGDGALYLSRMTASAENMRMLINDLLEFSRISNAQQPFSEVDLNVVVRQVKMDLELVIEETGTHLKADKLPVLVAIPTQMKQLLTNIISNAIKFRQVGIPPVITIEATEINQATKTRYDLSRDEVYYKIEITDNGIGFEEEYASRIFNVFQRLHGKSEYPGSGIGLAICKKIVEHHNGVIYAESLPGKGSKFVFIIPEKRK